MVFPNRFFRQIYMISSRIPVVYGISSGHFLGPLAITCKKKRCENRKKKSSIKMKVAFGHQTFDLLDGEAKERGVTVQELMRAVIIPDWFRNNREPLNKITMPEARP